MASSDISRLVKTRGHIRAQVSKCYQNVKASVADFSRVKKQQTIGKFKSMQTDLKSLNEQIHSLKFSNLSEEQSGEYTTELEACDSYEDRILESIAILEDSLPASNSNSSNRNSQLQQPVVPLPKFESKPGESIEKFLTSFEAVVAQNNYDDYPKFLLLKKQISGRASFLIDSLESSKQSYKEA